MQLAGIANWHRDRRSFLGWHGSQASVARPIAKAHPTEARAVLAAANAYWDEKMSEYGSGLDFFAGTEGIHLWSCRIMEAERALADTQQEEQAALLSHWQRMDSAYRQVKALYVTGAKGGEADRFAAAGYYRAEAELWLVAAGGTVPQHRDPPDAFIDAEAD